MNQLEKQVLLLIPIGKERPRPTAEIARSLGMKQRSVMEIVSRLITRYKIPIIGERGENNGYYIPANEVERQAGLQALENQTKEQIKRLNVATYCSLTEWKEFLEDDEPDTN